jgi:hypothetical protein
VVVLATALEEVRVVRSQVGVDTRAAQVMGDGVLPDLDGSPGPPQEVEGAAEDVVAGGHTGEGAGVVAIEAGRTPREAVEMGGIELGRAVGAEHPAVQAVEEHNDGVPGAALRFGLAHGGMSSGIGNGREASAPRSGVILLGSGVRALRVSWRPGR